GTGVHADLVAARPPEQTIDRHAPRLASDVPQGHVDGRERVRHERPAAHVAVGAVDFLPEIFNARRVLAVEQLEQRLREGAGDVRLQSGDLAPAGDLEVRLDLDIRLGPGGHGAQARDLQPGATVLDLL